MTDKKRKFKVIRCSRCGIPSPYGSAHICDEVAYAEHQLSMPLGKRIVNWFKGEAIAN